MNKLGVVGGLLAVLALLVACGQPGPTAGTVTSVSIDQGDAAIAVGNSLALSVTVTATGGADEGVTWSTGDAAVATVSASGFVQAVSAGSATVTATSITDSSKQDSVVITVTAVPEVVSVSILDKEGAGELGVGASLTLGVSVIATGGVDESVTWSTGDDSVATVSMTGVVEAVAEGSTSITVTSVVDSSKSDSIEITVSKVHWTRQFGTTDDDVATAVAVDSEGNIVVAGRTDGVLEAASIGNTDAFVRKYDSQGEVMWTSQFGTASDDTATAVAVDSVGNIVVVGYTQGGFEDHPESKVHTFVRMYNSAGTVLWTSRFGNESHVQAQSVAVGSDGNIVVAGYMFGDFMGNHAPRPDAFVRTFDSEGVVGWTDIFGTPHGDRAESVAVDAGGNIVVVGYTEGELLGDPEARDNDAFVRKYASDGVELWTIQFYPDNYEAAFAVAVDSAGGIVVAGNREGITEPGITDGAEDVFVHKYDGSGTLLWARQFGTVRDDNAFGVAVDSDGNVVVAGFTSGDLDGTSAGGRDAYIRKYDSDGEEVLWTSQFGSTLNDHAYAVAVDSGGNVLVVGSMRGQWQGTSGIHDDAFVRKYAP